MSTNESVRTGKEFAVGVDVGGTHTDLILSAPDGLVRAKAFTTHGNYSEGIGNALSLAAEQLGLESSELIPRLRVFVNGSTIVTNAVTELRGAKVGVLITRGFRDTFRIAGGARRPVYDDHLQTSPPDVVARDCIEEIEERVGYDGSVLVPLDEREVRAAVHRLMDRGVEAIAVCYLWSFSEPKHEKRTREIIREEAPELFVTLSSEICAVINEYPRFLTAVFNCLSHRATTRYIKQLRSLLDSSGFDGSFTFFQGIGGSVGPAAVEAEPIKLLASGPAGGVMAARHIGEQLGLKHVLVGDMGGTSFDTSVLRDLEPVIVKSVSWDVFRTGVDIVDVVSVGSGGGSIAWIDNRGVPNVGPQSAGSEPGPACYGKGGTEPTVTDANVVLGLIDPGNYLRGRHRLDADAARSALAARIAEPLGWSVEQAAAGVYDLSVVNMADALRMVSIERGYDPREFTFFAYGGGLGLFAVEICRRMGIPKIVIPDNSSAFSAYGVLIADYVRQYNRTVQWMLAEPGQVDAVNEAFAALREQAIADAALEGISAKDLVIERSGDFRFMGQVFEITVPLPDRDFTADEGPRLAGEFPSIYESNYGEGTSWKDAPVVLMNVTIRATFKRPKPPLREAGDEAHGDSPAPVSTRQVYLPGERRRAEVPIYAEKDLAPGSRISGPAIVDVGDTTIYLPDRAHCSRDRYFNFILDA